jgi:sec-independent protein translocase protein TatA
MPGIGFWELIIILLIVVMLFGAKRIPDIMGGLGRGIKSFKKAMETEDEPAAASPSSSRPESGQNEKAEKTEPK